MRRFLLVGLTGGIATGKSTVTAMLASPSVRVVDADALAREVGIRNEPPGKRRIDGHLRPCPNLLPERIGKSGDPLCRTGGEGPRSLPPILISVIPKADLGPRHPCIPVGRGANWEHTVAV